MTDLSDRKPTRSRTLKVTPLEAGDAVILQCEVSERGDQSDFQDWPAIDRDVHPMVLIWEKKGKQVFLGNSTTMQQKQVFADDEAFAGVLYDLGVL